MDTDAEEWEQQLKLELELKRKGTTTTKPTSNATTNHHRIASKSNQNVVAESMDLSPEDLALLEEQTKQRNKVSYLLDTVLARTLQTVQTMCASDIEIGNECLPPLASFVVQAASTTAGTATTNVLAEETLRVMASCVYEMEESFAPAMAQSLLIAASSSSELPSPCPTDGGPNYPQEEEEDERHCYPTSRNPRESFPVGKRNEGLFIISPVK